MEINDKLLDELLAQAGTNERRRINLDLRNGEGLATGNACSYSSSY